MLIDYMCISLKVTHPGLVKITDLQMGEYVFQLTVTDTVGQRSSDNVTVTVLAPEHHAEGEKWPFQQTFITESKIALKKDKCEAVFRGYQFRTRD